MLLHACRMRPLMVYMLPVARRRALLACSSNAPKVISLECPATSTPSRRTFPIAFSSPPLGYTDPIATLYRIVYSGCMPSAMCAVHPGLIVSLHAKLSAAHPVHDKSTVFQVPSIDDFRQDTLVLRHRDGQCHRRRCGSMLLCLRPCAVSVLRSEIHLHHR